MKQASHGICNVFGEFRAFPLSLIKNELTTEQDGGHFVDSKSA